MTSTTPIEYLSPLICLSGGEVRPDRYLIHCATRSICAAKDGFPILAEFNAYKVIRYAQFKSTPYVGFEPLARP